MSDLAYLDTLSNKELLAKCLEHGLPGVPVTGSTRNVIVRRLKAAISGTPLNKSKSAIKKSTPRRETVHGSQMAAPTSEPVRRTLGRSAGRINSSGSQITEQGRRTIAYGLDNTSISGRSVQTTTTVSDVGSQSEDDDYYMVDAPVVRFHAKQTPPREDKQLRRSVSLTKSGVLTTSYTREVEQPQYEQEDIPRSHTYERPRVPAAPLHSLPTYEPRIESPTYRRTDLGFSRPLLTQTNLNSTSYQEASGFNPSLSPVSPRNTFSGSARPFGGPAPVPVLPRQRQTVTAGGHNLARGLLVQPTTSVNTLYPQLNQFYDQPDNAGEPMDTESESEVEEAPIRRSHIPKTRSSPLARKPLLRHQNQVSPMSQFRALVVSLDQKYNLKFYFILVVTVMLATMVYVVLTPNA
ncbi:LEM domain-containing protein Bocksbeutel [Drosophila elegans]|uniref:LEM domain-containing protein Bocksbeutel n=1 Tax=Drosophila elegans TaxID=30023 RepID=UPI0007E7CD69|nr:LEM domain-containing protein Bocksbeutel [Drosophila elegans]